MKYFEDFQIGEKIITRGRTVTETDVTNFAAFTGDWYPLHVNTEYAKKTRFGERIAHGMLTLSLATGLWSPEYTSKLAFVAFYGMDKVRFTAPVKIGDTLHVEFEVVDKEDKGERGGIVSFKQTIKNQREEITSLAIIKFVITKQLSSQA